MASAAPQRAINDKPYGTERGELGLPETVIITTEDGKTFEVPVSWEGYDSGLLTEQTLTGVLDLTEIAAEVENSAGVTASIKVTLQPFEPGTVDYENLTVVYSGKPVRHEIAGEIAGVTDITYAYAGEDGTYYLSSADAPTDVGSYTVTATFAMEAGYRQIDSVTVRLTIVKADPNVKPPQPNLGLVYTGSAQALVTAGEAEGGTMLYSIDGENYSPEIPARANAEDYTVWYKVVGDSNHNDTEPQSIDVSIAPFALDIPAQKFTYCGVSTFTITLGGANGETVTVTLIADSKDAGSYEYDAAERAYAAKLTNANYAIGAAKTLTIEPLTAALRWSNPLTFTYDGKIKSVTAEVSNAVAGDTFDLSYTGNTGTVRGDYTAQVTDLGNANYALENASQPWHITQASETVVLTAAEEITYGDALKLTVTIRSAETTEDTDTVAFYANGALLKTLPVGEDDTADDSNTVILTVNATSANGFYAGTNAVKAVYSGNDNVESGEAAISVTVNPKPVTAAIAGDTAKTYDGTAAASGLALVLEGVEACDDGKVTASAETFTYNSRNVTDAKIGRASCRERVCQLV